jgi:serine/threonine protein kinase
MDPKSVTDPCTSDTTPTRPAPEPPGPDAGGPDRVGDFVLLRELGHGSFARVYLAHQVSLGRKVALKVTAWPSRGEGRILAGLEHDHVVKVYAEFDDPTSDRRGLVLQYVPGTNLARVLAVLFRDGRRPADGQAILDAIDRLARDEVDFDPAALGDRELYRHGTYASTVCRLAARLAAALAFAHARGVLHCDVKPANILLNRYGRPLLADFNVSVPARGEATPAAVGGTHLYMSPEQLTAVCRPAEAPPIDHRTDLYSLGLVIVEAITGRLPLAAGTRPAVGYQAARTQPPEVWLAELVPGIPAPLWRVLRRCLAPDPADRFADGIELAAALQHAADLLDAEARLPVRGPLGRLAWHWPMRTLVALTFLPHLVGSIVNIAYNTFQIPLTPAQQVAFDRVTLLYNLTVYPLCVAAAMAVAAPLTAALRRPEQLASLPAAELDRLRRRALQLGGWAVGLALVGWLPGGVIFPLAIDAWAGGVGADVFGHFVLSFALSGLIAITYSFLGIQFVVVRGIYPRLTHPDQDPTRFARELHGVLRGLRVVPALAAVVPLTGAVLQLVLAPGDLSFGFRLLVTGLIVAGMLGLGVAVGVANHLRLLVALVTRPRANHLPG